MMPSRHLARFVSMFTAAVFVSGIVALAAQTPRVRVGGDIKRPTLLKQVQPAYPSDAKERGIQGTVFLEVIINTEGFISGLEVVRSAEASLDAAAAENVIQLNPLLRC